MTAVSENVFSASICVRADHPSLPGHFPGEPIVPGVLLLEAVARALRAWRGQRLACVAEAKFTRPLRPEQQAELELRDAGQAASGSRVRFVIRCGDDILARGLVLGETPAEAAA